MFEEEKRLGGGGLGVILDHIGVTTRQSRRIWKGVLGAAQ